MNDPRISITSMHQVQTRKETHDSANLKRGLVTPNPRLAK
jgi:hypothetical protein